MVQLSALPRDAPEQVGGKALHLAELISGGFAVPDGFCVTTCAYRRVVQDAVLEQRLDDLAATPPDDASSLSRLAQDIARLVLARPVPADITDSVVAAYQQLGEAVPVAVRSSATAEDLPFASFAGQQDTYPRRGRRRSRARRGSRCWASLWTDRAVVLPGESGASTREQSGSPSWCSAWCDCRRWPACCSPPTRSPGDGARPSSTPAPGLGEAVVSGAVNPDHFVVDTATGTVLHRRLGDKRVAIRSGAGRRHQRRRRRRAQTCPA